MRYHWTCLLICTFAISCSRPPEATTQPATQPVAAAQTQNEIPYALIATCIKQIEPYKYTPRQLARFSTNHPPYASRQVVGIKVIYHKPYGSIMPSPPGSGDSRLTFVDGTADLMLVIRFRQDTQKVLAVSMTDVKGYAKAIDNPQRKAIYYLKKTQEAGS